MSNLVSSSIASLPPELLAAILDTVNLEDLQKISFALYQVFPLAVSDRYLFRAIVLRQPAQVIKLWTRLSKSNAPIEGVVSPKDRVERFSFLGWKVDADVLNNLLQLLPRIEVLHINVGTTFAPEHLDDMFKQPRPQLKQLSIRFRPYFERATYYQFMAGAYFDSMLNELAKWPKGSLETLSILQDPIPTHITGPDGHSVGTSMTFAQPIVFFSIDPISTLAKSPLARTVQALRFRVPSRTIWHKLCEPLAFPDITFLDLSTSHVNSDQAILAILSTFPLLEHLVLDGSGFCGNGKERDGWKEMGRAMAIAGIKKAREKERELRSLTGLQISKIKKKAPKRSEPSLKMGLKKKHHGEPSSDPDPPEPPASVTTLMSTLSSGFRILAPPPRLLTLSAASTPREDLQGSVDEQQRWTQELETGWKEGILRLREHWQRTRTFGQNTSVRILSFDFDAASDEDTSAGLADDDGMPELIENDLWDTPPLLCFGCETDPTQLGVSEGKALVKHRERCGHAIGREIWQ